jgi:hypothetical protein
VRLIVVPEAYQRAAEAAVRGALAEERATADDFAFTLIRLAGHLEWRVHVSSACGKHPRLAQLIQQKLREAGL